MSPSAFYWVSFITAATLAATSASTQTPNAERARRQARSHRLLAAAERARKNRRQDGQRRAQLHPAAGSRIAFTYSYNTSRRILVGDNLKLPAHPQPTYFGTAVAHWDAETLVIETSGLRDSAHDKIWLDENGNPTSDQTTVVER